MNYSPAPLGIVLPWLAKENVTGLCLEDQRDELIEYVNDIRQKWYNRYDEIRLFDNYMSCECIEKYPEYCESRGKGFYYGVTLPVDMAGIDKAWINDRPLKNRTTWYRDENDMYDCGYGDLEIIPVSEEIPLRHPLLKPSKIKISTTSRFDEDKKFIIEGLCLVGDGDGGLTEEEVSFCGELPRLSSVMSELPFSEVDNIELPFDLVGKVEFHDEDGRLLLSAGRGDFMPRFRRYRLPRIKKLEGRLSKAKHIAIKGKREFRPIYEDRDIVEIGDKSIIEYSARMIRYQSSTDPSEIQISQFNENMMDKTIMSIKNRYKSGEKQDRPKRFNRQSTYSHKSLDNISKYHTNNRLR